jgi:drug/metabolite transporter (DMT)-like permease
MADRLTAQAETKQQRVEAKRQRVLVVLAFFCIYVIWGSTYLAVHYAVETIPPLFVAGLRHLFAGGLLFAWCWQRGLRPDKRQWYASLILGVLFFLIGHGTLHWAIQTMPSGLAALLVATEPVWIALMTAATRQARITPTLVAGLVLGVCGVALLIGSDAPGSRGVLLSSVVVLAGTFSWALGIMYSRRSNLHPDAIMSAAMSLLAGALLLLLAGALTGEAASLRLAQVSLRSLLGLAYLTVFGSLVAYSAYFWLLQRRPPALVATHTYANPIVALLLGWAMAGEAITGRIVFSAAAVVAAVALVSKGSRQADKTTAARQQEQAASADLARRAV